jgi:hypothetical protein
LGNTQPLTEMSTRNLLWGVKRPVLGVDKFITFICQLCRNFGRLNLLEHKGPVQTSNWMSFPLKLNAMVQGLAATNIVPYVFG